MQSEVRIDRSPRSALRSRRVCQKVLPVPPAAHTTPRLGYLSAEAGFPEMFDRLQRYVAFTPLHNASGAPGISVPAGLTREGLPIGVHLSARLGQDRTLLELAYELEAARPFPSLLA